MLSLYLGFSLLRESLSPSCAVLLSVLPGLKSFAAIWSCLSLGKKKEAWILPQMALSCREGKHVCTLLES